MELAKVSLTLLTKRVNELLGTNHSIQYISAVRSGKDGAAALQRVVRQEVAAMLSEAAEAAKVA